jgi:type I restriction enzyme S subunit
MIEEVKLVDVCDVIAGQSPPSSTYNQEGNGTPFFQGKADFGETYPTVRYWCDSPKKMSEPDDILFSVRAPVGPTNINNINACIGRGLAAIRCREIERNYLLHYLRGNEEKISSLGSGSTFKAITIGTLKDLKIPLPPLDQQKKIASILDAADAYRQKTKALIEKYDELTQSLFLDMFGDPVSNPREWEFKKFQDFTIKYNQGVNTTTEEIKYSDEGTFPIIRAGEVGKGSLKFDSVVWVDKENESKMKNSCKPIKGDVLYANIGANLGTACLVETSRSFGIAWNVFRIQLKEKINRKFFVYQLNCEWIKRIVWSKVKTATVPFISGKQISSIDFINPPIELQNQFADRVQAIEQQKAQANASLAQAEDLFNSLLQRAFKGELTS